MTRRFEPYNLRAIGHSDARCGRTRECCNIYSIINNVSTLSEYGSDTESVSVSAL